MCDRGKNTDLSLSPEGRREKTLKETEERKQKERCDERSKDGGQVEVRRRIWRKEKSVRVKEMISREEEEDERWETKRGGDKEGQREKDASTKKWRDQREEEKTEREDEDEEIEVSSSGCDDDDTRVIPQIRNTHTHTQVQALTWGRCEVIICETLRLRNEGKQLWAAVWDNPQLLFEPSQR